MNPLEKSLRNELARTVLAARTLAEEAAGKALHTLGVDESDAPGHLDNDGRRLRIRLRAQAKQLGDREDRQKKGGYEIRHLTEKIAYDHWHRLLFARFLAENDLLISPEHGVGVSLSDCEELAPALGLRDGWEVASNFAARMLPQIFRADDPAGNVLFAPEDRVALRKLVTDLPRDTFLVDDSLGWVYQFWQAQRKDEVNKSGDKIGADEIAPVTQLFTEDYMVLFLLHNTLGAWWAGKQKSEARSQKSEEECRQSVALPGVNWEYLRFTSPLNPLSMNGEGTLEKKPVVARNFVTPEKLELARKFRRDPTAKEGEVWEWLRDRRMHDLKWRRQQVIEGFVADFYCAEHHLALEIDGDVHDSEEAKTYDEVRDAVFEEKGIRTLRIKNNECTKESLHRSIAAALTPPSPFMERGQGGEVWRPAAGVFDGWPKTAKELRLLDPCMGSGHFVAAELPILVAMRMAEEGLSVADAVEAVLRDNLFGLELDPRCTQIAAFNLALAAWKLIGQYRQLPPLNLACCGLGINARKEDWVRLANDDTKLRGGMEQLFDLFQKAPDLGSLINPRGIGDLLVAEFHELQPLLEQALTREETKRDETLIEMGVTARGLTHAAEILAGQFTLVATNVPYLGQKKQDHILKQFCEQNYPHAKADLGTCFVERCLVFCRNNATVGLVTPQNWLFLGAYKRLRSRLLKVARWDFLTRLGEGAFDSPQAAGAFTATVVLSHRTPDAGHQIASMDVAGADGPTGKELGLRSGSVVVVGQKGQLDNPDFRLSLEEGTLLPLLSAYAISMRGIVSGDSDSWYRQFWELPMVSQDWKPLQTTVQDCNLFGGRDKIVNWSTNGEGMLRPGTKNHAYGHCGVALGQMRELPATLYTGELYDNNTGVIVPLNAELLPAIWSFCSSEQFHIEVRKIDQALKVTNASLVKVPFDLAHWQKVAAEKYPHGLPKPHSDDPTQWLFNGHPKGSTAPLQVAVARLLGYRWPRQTGSSFPDCPALDPDGLEKFSEADGIVCLNAIKGEQPAAERLRALLSAAFGGEWTAARQGELLEAVGYGSKTLEEWLRNGVFEQHCQMFHQRPFIWQVWDGLRDGFSALVNYHRLDRPTLEKLTYTYLGDWIARQKAAVAAGEEGSDAKLAAAQELKAALEKILEGEPPYDIFVRWKPLEKQPIGWDPDLNDGVRLNIRPFVEAGILRKTPKINWNKDRGKDVPSAPWFKIFKGDRINDHHLTLEEKRNAREA